MIEQGLVRLAVAPSGRLQGVILRVDSQLNSSAFHPCTLRTHGTGSAVLTEELNKHAGLAFFHRLTAVSKLVYMIPAMVIMLSQKF